MDGVMLVSHGTIQNLDDIPEFLLRIRRGRPASAQLVEEMQRRYAAIGRSPLNEITRRQARALEDALGIPVLVAARLWEPGIQAGLQEAMRLGVARLVVLPMAPFSVHVYDAAVRSTAKEIGERGLQLVSVPPWGSLPDIVEAQAELIAPQLDNKAELVLTAHSLPLAAVRHGDPYQEQVEACSAAVAKRLARDARLAYQSQGADGGEWLGPDLLEVLKELAGQGKRSVVVAPVGFVADHVETLYDLDIEAKAEAEKLGLEWRRVRAVNDSNRFISGLARLVRESLGLPVAEN